MSPGRRRRRISPALRGQVPRALVRRRQRPEDVPRRRVRTRQVRLRNLRRRRLFFRRRRLLGDGGGAGAVAVVMLISLRGARRRDGLFQRGVEQREVNWCGGGRGGAVR